MKVIEVNKKRIGVSIILIGLMLILLGLAKNFDPMIKETVLMEKSSNKMKSYSALKKHFTYKLPKTWNASEEKFNSNEVIYHNNFLSQDKTINGFVEVWNITEDLSSFLEKSKNISEEQNIIKTYNISDVNVSGHNGYKISYILTNPKDINYKCLEYFIKHKNMVFRFSFFIKENDYIESMITEFENIVKTFNYVE